MQADRIVRAAAAQATTDGPHPDSAPRRVSVLGATGSVGRSTMDLVAAGGPAYEVEALTAQHNTADLAALATRFGARFAAIGDPARYGELKAALAGTGCEAAAGPDAVVEAAAREADWVMAGIVGAAGLAPTLAAVRAGRMVAFANKECLVSAGRLMMQEVAAAGATLLPVDSEHNAIFQVFEEPNRARVERLVLTASGGPFRERDLAGMRAVTPAEAVAHPNWDMGAKISVDSATMMNKGLEVIEAHHLFAMPAEAIEVLIHPQSIVHSMVGYSDGSVLAQLGAPDMRIPIAHALAWPGRLANDSPRLDLAAMSRLDFTAPDAARFPALGLAREALAAGPWAPPALNAANEAAVAAFLAGRIGFLDIAGVGETVLARTEATTPADIAAVTEIDAAARRTAEAAIAELAGRRG